LTAYDAVNFPHENINILTKILQSKMKNGIQVLGVKTLHGLVSRDLIKKAQ
jgi:hypothetical protein